MWAPVIWGTGWMSYEPFARVHHQSYHVCKHVKEITYWPSKHKHYWMRLQLYTGMVYQHVLMMDYITHIWRKILFTLYFSVVTRKTISCHFLLPVNCTSLLILARWISFLLIFKFYYLSFFFFFFSLAFSKFYYIWFFIMHT